MQVGALRNELVQQLLRFPGKQHIAHVEHHCVDLLPGHGVKEIVNHQTHTEIHLTDIIT